MTNFETPVQYDVALCDDAIVRGELLFAARRGDKAAARTLKTWREQNPSAPREPTTDDRGIERGRALYDTSNRRRGHLNGYGRPDDAA